MPDRSPQIRVTSLPADTNPYGGVYGGWLMEAIKQLCENPMGMVV